MGVRPFSSEFGDFTLHVFRNTLDNRHHLALTMGALGPEPTLVRVHGGNLLGDVLRMRGLDTHRALGASLEAVARAGRGAVLYMEHPSDGGELIRRLDARPGEAPPMSFRDYGIGAQILVALGLRKIPACSPTARARSSASTATASKSWSKYPFDAGTPDPMSSQPPVFPAISGAPFRVGVVAARYNDRLVDALLAQVIGSLRAAGVREKNITVARVPGSNELPIAAQLLAAARPQPSVIVALGVLIRGDTIHYGLIAETVAQALQRVALDARLPVINGVVVAETRAQAEARCLGTIDRGAEFARAALAMAALAMNNGQ